MDNISDIIIGKNKFQIHKYGMSYRLSMLAKLTQLISGPAKSIGGSDIDSLKSGNLEISTVIKLISSLFESVSPEEFPSIIKEFLKGTKLKGNIAMVEVSEVFETIFEDMDEVFELLKEVIVFQFDKDLTKIFNRFLVLPATEKKETQVAGTQKIRAK